VLHLGNLSFRSTAATAAAGPTSSAAGDEEGSSVDKSTGSSSAHALDAAAALLGVSAVSVLVITNTANLL
jgi:hypothetical protein